MSQIINITSEALQATMRRLLPSQQGFGEDLQASNVILPVIDVTPTAEGSQLAPALQNALSFGSATAFRSQNSTATIANSPGFYRVFGSATLLQANPAANLFLNISDGASSKTLWGLDSDTSPNVEVFAAINFDFTIFLDTNITLTMVSNNIRATAVGSSYQVADRYGNLSNPAGFTFE